MARTDAGITRARLLRSALGGGTALAAGAAIGAGRDDGASLAAPSASGDAEILNLFLLLERVQLAYYRHAIESGKLAGELLHYAATVADQEAAHEAFLRKRLGGRARDVAVAAPEAAVGSAEQFRAGAIALEEAAIAAYIGQAANLTRPLIAPIAELTSVEARQVAWVRDLAGVNPAPRAADPARAAAAVTADLQRKGFLR